MARDKLPPTEPTTLPPLPDEEILAAQNWAAAEFAEIDRQYGDIVPYRYEASVNKVRYLLGQSAEAMLEAGRELILIKEHEGHGGLLATAEKLGLEPRLAQMMMRAALKFGANAKTFSHFGKAKIYELAFLDDEEIEALGEGGTVRGYTPDELSRMSVRELKEALRKKDKAIADLKENYEQQGKLIAGKDEMINDLSVQLGKRQKDPPELKRKAELDALHQETLGLCNRIDADLRSKITALFAGYGPVPPEHVRMAASQSLGQIIGMAHDLAGDFTLRALSTAEATAVRPNDAMWTAAETASEADAVNAELGDAPAAEPVDDKMLTWLTHYPATDINFVNTVAHTNKPTLQAALEADLTQTARNRIEARLRKLERADSKSGAGA